MKLLAAAAAAVPGLAGFALVSYGAWLAYHPAGYVVAGALIFADVVASSSTPAPVEPPDGDAL